MSPRSVLANDRGVGATILRGRVCRLAKTGHACARFRRFLLPDDSEGFFQRRRSQAVTFERRHPGQKFVENHAQRVDVGPRVDVQLVQHRLFGAHVFPRADDLPDLSEQRPFGELLIGCLRDAEIDDFGHRTIVVKSHQDVGRF